MSERFAKAFHNLMRWEGWYDDHPADRGGETIYGISRVYNPNWEGWEAVDRKDWVQAYRLAQEFYRKEYWEALRLDEVKLFEIADFIFDTAVNLGKTRAVKLLQKSLNLAGDFQLKVDGILGDKTLSAINRAPSERLMVIYRGYRAHHYISLVEKGYGEEFIFGWLRRVRIPGVVV